MMYSIGMGTTITIVWMIACTAAIIVTLKEYKDSLPKKEEEQEDK